MYAQKWIQVSRNHSHQGRLRCSGRKVIRRRKNQRLCRFQSRQKTTKRRPRHKRQRQRQRKNERTTSKDQSQTLLKVPGHDLLIYNLPD